MKRQIDTWRWCVILAVLAGTIGCSNPTEELQLRMSRLDSTWLDTVVRKNIAATGGLDKWARLMRVESDALATLSGADGGESLITQQHVIFPEGQLKMRMRSQEHDGWLVEELRRDDSATVVKHGTNDSMPLTDVGVVGGAQVKLLLLHQALLGGVGLLHQERPLRHLGQERKGGRMMHIVEVGGPTEAEAEKGTLLVLWFDSETLLLDRLWLRYHNAPGDGSTVAFGYMGCQINNYVKTAEGLFLPQRIELVRSDEHRQFTEHRLMVIEYEQLRAVLAEKKEHKKVLGIF